MDTGQYGWDINTTTDKYRYILKLYIHRYYAQ